MKLLLSLAWLLFAVTPLYSQSETLLLASSNYYPHYAEDLPKQGAVSELVRQAFILQGIDIEIAFMPFARAYRESLQANYIGLIAAWYDDERAQHFYYSQPLYANHIVFFKRKGMQIQYSDYADIARQRLRLALVQGYLQPPGLVESTPNMVSVALDEQAFQMLARSRVDLVPADKLNGLYLLQHKLPQYADTLDWLTPALELRPMYLLLSKRDPRSEQLMQQFNQGLAELRQSGQYQRILHALLPQHSEP
ncbi:substrate-binding periplasmic protein [Rheinheimera nanhaiensis]|uniref:Polar amino acid transport system substrate-binding protein n=1 Tax=Rheinheimera nanhaiensis E407-8 TaxID=562729 RepID=I1DVU8_9GAMM|nr:transporter substrate-binding domain-containing protein [Rheinheimera nanhaiensis]GAB58176.1 polar amino acid transport system substrate-binding protein [Rheinheimera nanhaiensis E407-8]